MSSRRYLFEKTFFVFPKYGKDGKSYAKNGDVTGDFRVFVRVSVALNDNPSIVKPVVSSRSEPFVAFDYGDTALSKSITRL